MRCAEQEAVAAKFLQEHPEFCKVEWTHADGVTVYYANGLNEPMGIVEFLPDSPTRILIEDLEDELDLIDAKTPKNGVKR